MVIAAASQTITERIKCQRNASICPIKDISSGSALSLLRRRLKNCFLSDDSVANDIIWIAKVNYNWLNPTAGIFFTFPVRFNMPQPCSSPFRALLKDFKRI